MKNGVSEWMCQGTGLSVYAKQTFLRPKILDFLRSFKTQWKPCVWESLEKLLHIKENISRGVKFSFRNALAEVDIDDIEFHVGVMLLYFLSIISFLVFLSAYIVCVVVKGGNVKVIKLRVWR